MSKVAKVTPAKQELIDTCAEKSLNNLTKQDITGVTGGNIAQFTLFNKVPKYMIL